MKTLKKRQVAETRKIRNEENQTPSTPSTKKVESTHGQIEKRNLIPIKTNFPIDNKIRHPSNKNLKSTHGQIEKRNLVPVKKDFINTVNDNTLVRIFKYLPPYDRLKIEKVCSRWKRLGPSSWLGIEKFDSSSFKVNLYRAEKEEKKFVKAVRRMKNLKSLKIKKDNFSYDRKKNVEIYLQIFQNAPPELDEIIINPDSFCSDTFKIKLELGHFNALRHLVLTQVHLNGNALKEITAKSTLVHLNLERCCFNEGANLIMSNLINLEYLNLFKYEWECGGHYIRIENLKNCKKLKYLNLASRFCIPKSDLQDISELIHLEYLNLDGLGKLSNKVITGISNNCKKIKELTISGCGLLSKKGLDEIKKLENLEKLAMSNIKKAKDDMFTGMKNLTSLDCKKCKRITDAGIITILNNCPKLYHLSVIDTKVTSKTVICAIDVVHQRKNDDSPSLGVFVTEKTVDCPKEMMNKPRKLTVHFHIPRKRRIFNLDTGCYSSEESIVSDDEDDDDENEDEESNEDDDDAVNDNKKLADPYECASDSYDDFSSDSDEYCSDDFMLTDEYDDDDDSTD